MNKIGKSIAAGVRIVFLFHGAMDFIGFNQSWPKGFMQMLI